MNRRIALVLLGAGVLSSRLKAAQSQLREITNASEAPTLVCLHSATHRLVDTLAENIIPADNHSPGARAARVSYYIDLVLGNNAVVTHERWRAEMVAFERAAKPFLGERYLDADPDSQARFLDKLAATTNKTLETDSFARMGR